MTKQVLRSLVKNLLRKLDETNKYHDTLIDHALETVINQVYYEIHAQNPRALGQYTKQYTVTSLSGGTGGKSYCDLPVAIVPLPDKRGGVRGIVCSEDITVYFAPITDQEYSLSLASQGRGLIASDPMVINYIVHPDTIEFTGRYLSVVSNYTFLLDLIVAFTSLGNTDEVPLPYGKNAEIIEKTLQMLGVIAPVDLKDNNSDVQ